MIVAQRRMGGRLGDPMPRASCGVKSRCGESAGEGEGEDRESPVALRCAVCHHPNESSRKFCSHCGQSLWEPCPKCSEVSPAGTRYCGSCGVNLSEYVDNCVRQFEVQLGKIESLRRDCRFSEAIALLTPLSKSEHPRLSEPSARARRVIAQLRAECERKEIVAAERLAEAQQLLENRDFSGALASLSTVAEAMWTPAMTELAGELQGKLAQLAALERALAKSVQAGRLAELPKQIERILAIRPDHPEVLRLTRKLESHLIGEAKKRLGAQQYEVALTLLLQISHPHAGEEAIRLKEHARELVWIARELQTAPEANAALLALAERLAKAAPRDERARKVCDELRRRPGVLTARGTAWRAAPENTPLGCPIERAVVSLEGILREGVDPSPFAAAPDAWLCAMGLALQSLGEGPVAIDLLPTEKRSVFERMTRLVRPRPTAAWGIDIGSSGIRAVRMSRAVGGVAIDDAAQVAHRLPLGLAANAEEAEQVLADSLAALREQVKIKRESVALSLAGTFTLARQFKVPAGNPAKFADLVAFEARQQLPFRLEDLFWGCQPMLSIAVNPRGLACEKIDVAETAVLAAATRRAPLARRLEFLAARGFPVDRVQVEGLAMHNALAWLAAKGAFGAYGVDDPAETVLVADIGGEATNIVVRAPDAMWLRTVGLGGLSFARAIKQEFDCSLPAAQRVMHDVTLAPSFGRLCEAVQPIFQSIAQELHVSFHAFEKANPGHRLGRVLITGGASRMHGLLRCLRCGR